MHLVLLLFWFYNQLKLPGCGGYIATENLSFSASHNANDRVSMGHNNE